MSQARGEAKSNLFEGDTADAALDSVLRNQSQRGLPSNLPVLNLIGQSQSTNHQLIEQLMHAEEKMKIAHQEDSHRHEEITMGLLAKMNEMVQEDQGSTLRIEELERRRDMLRTAVEHVNRVHQNSLEDHVHGIERIEEASHAQHLRDEELATSLHQELGQLRNDAAQTPTNTEHQVQGEGQRFAMEYQRLVNELNQKAHETLQFKMEASQNLSAMAIMKEQMGMMRNEESVLRDEANKKMSDLESGAQELRSRLDREEFAKSQTMMRLRQMETITVNEGGLSPSALHSEVGELRRRLKQQEELQARSQQAWRQEIEIARRYGVGNMNAQQSERVNAFRDAQLQDLLKTQGEERWLEMESEQQAIVSIGSIPLSITNRNNIKVTVTMQAKKKSHLRSRRLTLDQVGLVVARVEIRMGHHLTAVDTEEVILRDRRPRTQLMVEAMTLQRSRYPEGRLTKSLFLRSLLLILPAGCLIALPIC
ncbi:hypothetical protein AK812_SmicGene38098 [Symbiodinium microadriaticum]|uniref:Uncharacterized protein n=1 Tax=Symbiodinium microadriaticum TaxID=2951 RepID=A0A1Q9CEL7_SYMMI|nr:hypothetical protein AK812_SmicGene38098 [Symbiodinium microadriaticum]